MREFATCEGICSERKLELVSGGDYDELAAAAAACRAQIRGLWPIVEELAAAAPQPGDWRALYESMRERARLVVQRAGPRGREGCDEVVASAEARVVWRCPECGGLEAVQPCIGVCIWRPLDWVEVDAFETERAQVLRDIELERSLLGLLRRFARVTPRDGEWERNWRAFGAEAGQIVGSPGAGGVSAVGGHENLPVGGHRNAPLVAAISPHAWPRFLPTVLS
jgi:hypothetical protein